MSNCVCGQPEAAQFDDQGPVTREEALDLAYEALYDAKDEALAGRATEATVLNQTASLAISLANVAGLPLLNPLATGVIQ